MNAESQEFLLGGLSDHLASRVMPGCDNLTEPVKLTIWAIARDAYLQGAADCEKLIFADCQETLNAHLRQMTARNFQWQQAMQSPPSAPCFVSPSPRV